MLHFNQILVPIDFSERSLRALAYGIGFAEKFNAEVRVLYVHEPTPQVSDMAWQGADGSSIDDARLAEAKESLERVMKERVPGHVRAEASTRKGSPTKKIVEYAEETNTDLIVMATHGRTGLSHALMGSVAEAVLRKAPCPVLSLKHPMPVANEDVAETT